MKDQMMVQAEGAQPGRYVPPSREGKIIINFAAPPAIRKQIKDIANDQEKSAQALLLEAVNMLFEKYGKKPIA
jgi:hypothetical protein